MPRIVSGRGNDLKEVLLGRRRERLAFLGDENRGQFRRDGARVRRVVNLARQDVEDVAGFQLSLTVA
jgi:hypothetical protein